MTFDKDKFLDTPRVKTPVQLNGDTVYIRDASPRDVQIIRMGSQSEVQQGINLVIACTVDAEGKAVFTGADLPRLMNMPARLLTPLIDAATATITPDVDGELGKSLTTTGSDSDTG